jgi:hypothetical protein
MRHWTEEDRKRQAERIHQWQPWKTKGIKSAACKKASRRNAFKHGRYSASTKAIYSYLAASRMLIRALEQHRKLIKGAAKANRMCREPVAMIRGGSVQIISTDKPLRFAQEGG